MTTTATKRYPLARVSYGPEEIAVVVETLEAGETTCGKRVKAFEDRFAAYVGRKHAIMVNSGSSADLLVALGLGHAERGDEILVPAVTWPTQVWSCLMAGYTVRLVDVDQATLQFDPDDLMSKVNPRTQAIFTVHVLGGVGDMTALHEFVQVLPCVILEDCCEALGSRWKGEHVGTFGQAAAFSFFFSHVLNTMEGGMVVTDDDDRPYRLWRSHGWEPRKDYRFWFPTWGLNVRPTEVQGAFGNVQMGRLEQSIAARQRNYDRLVNGTHGYAHLTGIKVLPECTPAWHGYPLMVSPFAPYNRDVLCEYFNERGVETRPIIAGNLARQPAVLNEPRVITGQLPGADFVHKNGFYIGLASHDDEPGTTYVAEVLADFMKVYGC